MYGLKVVKFSDDLEAETQKNVVLYNAKDVPYKRCYLILLRSMFHAFKDFVYLGEAHSQVPRKCVMMNKTQRVNSRCFHGHEIGLGVFNVRSVPLLESVQFKVTWMTSILHRGKKVDLDTTSFQDDMMKIIQTHVVSVGQEIYLRHGDQVLVSTVVSMDAVLKMRDLVIPLIGGADMGETLKRGMVWSATKLIPLVEG